jgi:hypothetical protein
VLGGTAKRIIFVALVATTVGAVYAGCIDAATINPVSAAIRGAAIITINARFWIALVIYADSGS